MFSRFILELTVGKIKALVFRKLFYVALRSNNNTFDHFECGALKWHCYDPNANGWLDMSSTSCSDDNWQTRDCCETGEGLSCNRDTLILDADDVFNEWNSALG